MVNKVIVRESVVLKVDFVAASEARPSNAVPGGATILDLAEFRLSRATIGTRPAPRRRPPGGAPGSFGGPF